ncbi:chromosome partitioning protein ParA [Vibrio fluvialis]|uniref:chromosome partitioning protein ParA n=1 Tax=Vibrio fluvialis TaxID=676 RepID=UPI000C228020|nr:chromosome partitioning protein ParA [Vibrio fluvialis]MBY7825134.1 chromosome partitioning protein ParA [Vibrio fluvialis]MBY7882072.1 chromosome partitioning protein ParA [Vibrio fluvialis]MBY7925117.1 chromosome partitioning protein ParA [Vibrio fluvialis]MBY8009255.1 chromosome partitioning protein ParA [Vibrio fluvialis]MBY8253031.1 chromosome partitioning protein ParA [Vibrio fluvialis]
MNQKQLDDNEDVVVIEERDKRSYLYIGIAAVLGLALGGLIGSSVTASKWEKAYQTLETQYQQSKSDDSAQQADAEQQTIAMNSEWENKLQAALNEQTEQHKTNLSKLEKQITELEKVNATLESELSEQKDALAAADAKNSKLNRQADMQATMFERSRELFQKELKIKQEMEAMQKERDALVPQVKSLKKECDIYLEGKSWDAKSDACDKQDEANSRISQLDHMIRVHQMDLEQIKSLSEEIGL